MNHLVNLIIKQDYETIVSKIKAGKAHELSEGDTLYLAACRKGQKGDSLRKQPFSDIGAPQRAFSLKPAYMRTILDFVKHITNKTIILYHYQDIYTLLCNLQKLPTLPTYYQPEKHTTIKQILSTACKKEKAKSYFLSGLFFGIGSLFIRYNIYYMVMSTLLFLLALYALCNKKYNDTKP